MSGIVNVAFGIIIVAVICIFGYIVFDNSNTDILSKNTTGTLGGNNSYIPQLITSTATSTFDIFTLFLIFFIAFIFIVIFLAVLSYAKSG